MSAAAAGRVRRSIRFAQLQAESGTAGRDSALRRERITGAERLQMPSYQNTQDWTGGMGISPSGRFRVIEEPRPKQPVFSPAGVRQDWARALLWIMIAVMSVALLVCFASIGASSLRIQKLESRIETAKAKGLTLEADLAASSGDISVVTRAVELNLISSGGAATIQLTAPEGATMTLVQTGVPQATEEPDLRAAAETFQGD